MLQQSDLATTFERDGRITLRGAFDMAAAERMSEAIWKYCESRTEITQTDSSTWPRGAPGGLSFKKLKRHSAFRRALESASTRQALDEIFADGWEPTRSGAQILLSFPDAPHEEWRVPSHLWHMDAPFLTEVSPPRAVKLFSVVEPLLPRSGATVVIAGTHALQADYARTASEEHRTGDKQTWHRFMRRTDPWLARFVDPDDSPDRNALLATPQMIDGRQVELRELSGEPGDVHICHINLFHSVAPNVSDRPRVVVTHVVRPVREG